MTGKVPPSGQNPVQVPQLTEEELEAYDKHSHAVHPNLGKVSRAEGPVPTSSPETQATTESDQPEKKSILKRKTRRHSEDQPAVLSRERRSRRNKGVSFDEKPAQVAEHGHSDTDKLRTEIRATMLFLSGKDSELVGMLSAQFIHDMTTRSGKAPGNF